MNNRKLITIMFAAVAALVGIGLATFYDIDPKWTLLQGCALAAGICLMLVIQLLGWSRVLALAPAAYLTVGVLCAACFAGPSFEGVHRGLTLFGHRVFYPPYFAPLAVVCMMAWHQDQRSRTSVILASALLLAMIVMAMPYFSLAMIIMAILCVLARPVLASRPNANAKAIVTMLCAGFVVLQLAPVLYGRRTLAEHVFHGQFDFMHKNLIDVLGKCSWFGYGNGDCHTYTFSPIWDNPHVHCAYVMGLWAFVAVLLLFILLGFCFWFAWRRTERGPRRTLILGSSLVLLLPPLCSFAWLVFAFIGRGNIIPFLSMGGSTTLASFAALGVLLAAMRGGTSESMALLNKPRRVFALDVLLALLTVFSLSIGLTRHPPNPIPWFLTPSPSMPKRPPPVMRGRILAADDSILAYTTNQWQIRIDPQSKMGHTNVWTKPRIAEALSKELGLPYTNLIAHLHNPKNRYILLKETRDGNLVERLSKHAKDWRLVIEKYQGRVYPLGEMAAHYVGAAGKADSFYWEQHPTRGMFGVEYSENETLIEGKDIRLPLIPALQTNLWSVVKRLGTRHNADAAWAVMVTATNRTTRILAMTKCPSYDPEHYGSFREQQWENAPAHFGFELSAFEPHLIPSALTNDARLVTKRLKRLELNPPVGTNMSVSASAFQLARASAIIAAEEDEKPYRVVAVARAERTNQPVVVLLVQHDELALVLCVRAPKNAIACAEDLAEIDVDGQLELSFAK